MTQRHSIRLIPANYKHCSSRATLTIPC